MKCPLSQWSEQGWLLLRNPTHACNSCRNSFLKGSFLFALVQYLTSCRFPACCGSSTCCKCLSNHSLSSDRRLLMINLQSAMIETFHIKSSDLCYRWVMLSMLCCLVWHQMHEYNFLNSEVDSPILQTLYRPRNLPTQQRAFVTLLILVTVFHDIFVLCSCKFEWSYRSLQGGSSSLLPSSLETMMYQKWPWKYWKYCPCQVWVVACQSKQLLLVWIEDLKTSACWELRWQLSVTLIFDNIAIL